MAQQPLVSQGLLIIVASRSHSDTPHSLRLLWTSDQLDTVTSTWKHTTVIRNRHFCTGRDSNPQSQQARGRSPTPKTVPATGIGFRTWYSGEYLDRRERKSEAKTIQTLNFLIMYYQNPLVNSCVFYPNILLNILSSYTLNVRSPFTARNQITQHYKTLNTTIILFTNL
jgi:hypothetical protein